MPNWHVEQGGGRVAALLVSRGFSEPPRRLHARPEPCMHPSPATPAAAAIHRAIEDHAFPCVGAKAALARDAVQVVEGGDLRRPDSDAAVLEAIGRFASTHDHDVVFASLVVAYPRTQRLTEAAFEAALWERLQALH